MDFKKYNLPSKAIIGHPLFVCIATDKMFLGALIL